MTQCSTCRASAILDGLPCPWKGDGTYPAHPRGCANVERDPATWLPETMKTAKLRAGQEPSASASPSSPVAVANVTPETDLYPELPPCPHRTGRWSCCETLVFCAIGRGEAAGIVERHDCQGCEGPKMTIIDEWKFITKADLVRDVARLMAMLDPDIDLVVGISRSGLLPASLLAYDLHLPLWTVSRQSGVQDPGHGTRLEGRSGVEPKHVLLIDDTAVSGREMSANLPIVQARFPNARVSTAVVYAWPETALSLNFCASIYPGMHYLEWNWHNAGHGAQCGYDFDGILCRDFTHEECQDDETYRRVMADIEPLYLPRRLPVPLIVTARPEHTREITMAWLARWGVQCDRLVMRDFEIDSAKGWARHLAEYKAYHFDKSGCVIFAESDPEQAAIINELTGKPVLCPSAGKVFPSGIPHRWGMGAKP